MMNIRAAKIRIGVRDQERAYQFWTETMGCTVVVDETYGDERWLEVSLHDGVSLILELSDEPEQTAAGQPNTALFLGCDDVDTTVATLNERGATIVTEPMDMPFGRWAMVEDSEGNRIPLVAAT